MKKPVKLQFEELQVKKTPSALKSAVGALPATEVHRQIARSEDDNVGVETAHRLEGAAEGTVRTAQNAHRSHALKAERKSLKAEKKLDQANVSLLQNGQPVNSRLSTNPYPDGSKGSPSRRNTLRQSGKVWKPCEDGPNHCEDREKAKEALRRLLLVSRHSKFFWALSASSLLSC